jgi:predicted Zn-dependent protease
MNPTVPARPRRARWPAALVAATLALAPPASLAQIENLPRLGDAASDTLSPAAERRLGDSIMRQVRRDPSYVDDAELVDYLNRFAAPLAAAPAAGGLQFDFFPIADGTINAFALPGGWIGVHTGLIAAAETESELATVLAHEIGHVTQRHIARMLLEQKQASLLSMAAMVVALLAARSNPQAAMGGALLGDQVARQNMMSFSRDAEREADRVGFEMMRQAGFEPQGMVSFFGRMQLASRFYETNAPAYMRTHPLTGERMSDMQLRIRETRYRQRADSVEFLLLRARLRATGDESTDGRRNARAIAEKQVADSPGAGPAPWFGLASIAAVQRDWKRAEAALAQAQALHGAPHPYFERMAAGIRLASGDAPGAVARARQAMQRFPDSRALARVQAEALIAAGRPDEAVRLLKDQLVTWRSDAQLWRLLADAYARQGKRADSHRATAEQYLLLGSPLSAVDQLRVAQKAGDTDFYTASVIDARLRELEPEARRELEESRRNGPPR